MTCDYSIPTCDYGMHDWMWEEDGRRYCAICNILHPDTPQTRVVCAANRYKDIIVCSARHFDTRMHAQIAALDPILRPEHHSEWEQGFIDQWGNFMNRVDALAVATAAGQVDIVRPKTHPVTKLFSEDLY